MDPIQPNNFGHIEENSSSKHSRKKIYAYFLGGIIVLIFLFNFALGAPSNFPIGEIVSIGEGSGLRQVSFLLKEKNIINSRSAFEAFVILYGGEKHILWGDYLFDKKEPVYIIARRISKGEKYLAPVKITIPEGYTVEEIAGAFDLKLPDFNKEKFLVVAKPKEGYLF